MSDVACGEPPAGPLPSSSLHRSVSPLPCLLFSFLSFPCRHSAAPPSPSPSPPPPCKTSPRNPNPGDKDGTTLGTKGHVNKYLHKKNSLAVSKTDRLCLRYHMQNAAGSVQCEYSLLTKAEMTCKKKKHPVCQTFLKGPAIWR